MAWNKPRKPWNSKWGGFRRRGARKKIPLRALSRTVARKRTDWVWLYNDSGAFDGVNGCIIRCIEFGASFCEEPSTRIPIMPVGALGALYDDQVTIAKMRGFINMKPAWQQPSGCSTNDLSDVLSGKQWPIYCRAGLYKQSVPDILGGIPTFIDPNVGVDWTDVTALRKWNHIWQPRGRTGVTYLQAGHPVGVCSDVTRASYLTPATASGSQPSFTVPAIETDCTILTLQSEECALSSFHFEVEEPNWWRMPLNRNTPINLHEDDSLDIFVNWSMPRRDGTGCPPLCSQGPDDGFNPCAVTFSINLQVQLQFG